MSQTAYRTHHATEVTEALVGQKVTLAGWVDRRRDHGGVAFIDLRDNTGLVQIVIYDEEIARPLRSEFVIQVTGEVRLRPDGNENTHLATGKIEVVVEDLKVLAKADALPFQVSTALENESEKVTVDHVISYANHSDHIGRPPLSCGRGASAGGCLIKVSKLLACSRMV